MASKRTVNHTRSAIGQAATVIALSVAAVIAHAQVAAQKTPPASAAVDAASRTKSVCVDAQVDGQRALSYDCLGAQLQPKPAVSADASQTAAEARAKAPSNRVGTFNLSTERNRFGANWGKSATPQRPAQPVVVPPK